MNNVETLTHRSPRRWSIFRGDLTYYQRGLGGSHELKTGIWAAPSLSRDVTEPRAQRRVHARARRQIDPNNPAAGTVPVPPPLRIAARVPRRRPRATATSRIYVQDGWKPHRAPDAELRRPRRLRAPLRRHLRRRAHEQHQHRAARRRRVPGHRGRPQRAARVLRPRARAGQRPRSDHDLRPDVEPLPAATSTTPTATASSSRRSSRRPRPTRSTQLAFDPEPAPAVRRRVRDRLREAVPRSDQPRLSASRRYFKDGYAEVDINGIYPSGPNQPFLGFGRVDPNQGHDHAADQRHVEQGRRHQRRGDPREEPVAQLPGDDTASRGSGSTSTARGTRPTRRGSSSPTRSRTTATCRATCSATATTTASTAAATNRAWPIGRTRCGSRDSTSRRGTSGSRRATSSRPAAISGRVIQQIATRRSDLRAGHGPAGERHDAAEPARDVVALRLRDARRRAVSQRDHALSAAESGPHDQVRHAEHRGRRSASSTCSTPARTRSGIRARSAVGQGALPVALQPASAARVPDHGWVQVLGRGRVGKTSLAAAVAAALDADLDPPAVLRRPRHHARGLRVGLRAAAARAAHPRGGRRRWIATRARRELYSEAFLIKRPLLQAIDPNRTQAGGAADRRDRSRRRGVRRLPARAAGRIPDHDSRARHGARRRSRRSSSSRRTARARCTTR